MPLILRIDRYLRHCEVPPATFGRRAVNDPRLVFDIRRGRQLGPRVSARVDSFLRERGW